MPGAAAADGAPNKGQAKPLAPLPADFVGRLKVARAQMPGPSQVWRSLAGNPSFSHPRGHAQVALGGAACGLLLGAGLLLLALSESNKRLGFYLASLGAFHLLEFLMTAHGHPETVSFQNFVFDDNPQYWMAVAASLVEHALVTRWALAGPDSLYETLGLWVLLPVGLVLALGGQFIRTLAMFTASHNFTHMVAFEKRPRHELVSDGVYAVLRHPSYFGHFWWSVGLQLVLGNLGCAVAFALVLHGFFKARCRAEEGELVRFFGERYEEYRARTPTGIPMVP